MIGHHGMDPRGIILRHTKAIADILTQARVALSVYIACLGIWRGREALPHTVVAVITSWITDLLDGPLARRDPDRRQTWVGEHDAEADLATSVGLSVYLVFSGYVAAWLGIGLLLLTLGLWVTHSYQLAWPFYALPYAMLTMIAFRTIPLLGWALLLYLMGVLLLRWRRLKDQYLPEFFDALRAWRISRWHRD